MISEGAGKTDLGETLFRGLRSSGLCVLYVDDELRIRVAENPPPSWPDADTLKAQGLASVFDPFTHERLQAAKREVLATGAPQRLQALQQNGGGPPLVFELSLERDHDAADGAQGVGRGLFVSINDITDTRRRETALRELLHEVSHRSRNLLAILQSILGQTASRATSVADFEDKFRGRIASLAASQDLITFANWEGVRLDRLVEAQTGAMAADAGVPVEREGANPLLSPHAALHLGLALHELAANSHAFGVLSSGAGRLRVICTPLADGGARVEWVEELDTPLPQVEAWGFGRTVLQHVTPRALGGEVSYAVTERGVTYAVDLPPAEEVEA